MPVDAPLPLAFMHVPKSAGTSITGTLISATLPKTILGGFDRSIFGGFSAFETMSEAVRAYIYMNSADMPDSEFVAGHFAFSTLQERYPGTNLITVIREPMSRLLSHWAFLRAVPRDSTRQLGDWEERTCIAHADLIDFMVRPEVACLTDNAFTRMLLWPDPMIPLDGFIARENDAAILEKCQARLESFAFVGVLEDPDFWKKLEVHFRRTLVQRKDQVTEVMAPDLRLTLASALTDDALKAMQRLSRLDNKLWTLLAKRSMPNVNVANLRERTFARTIARTAFLARAT